MEPADRRTALVSLARALAEAERAADRSATVFEHGTLVVELYAPRGHDAQTPHSRDEVYVVARGHAMFWDGSVHRKVEPGSFVFVAAGQPHRFESFSADFAVWVLFYGPDGGEARG